MDTTMPPPRGKQAIDTVIPDRYSKPGHDRDCARAMWSQAHLGHSPISPVQVQHLMSIAWRAGVDLRPDMWRADPVKTFYAGIALGMVPFLIILAALWVIS